MLFIYGALQLGGIETFYVRMAKARYLKGEKTKFLLIAKKSSSDEELLREAKKYADVYFLDDYLVGNIFRLLTLHFLLIKPISFKKIAHVFDGVRQIHVSHSIYGLLYLRVKKILDLDVPLTMGVYHSKEFIWGGDDRLPFYERINRILFGCLLKSKSVYFFNEKLPELYSDYYDFNKDEINTFPLGVIESISSIDSLAKTKSSPLRIVSVGRLVGFKSYNLWMVDLVNKLSGLIDIEYHIYGTGPLEKDIIAKVACNGLSDKVLLKGSLPYSEFKNTISKYDLFVGSGTAIVEASSLGVPSIVGIESVVEPVSYGFICDIEGYSYNEDDLYRKLSVYDLLVMYHSLSEDDVLSLKARHISWAEKFTMNSCLDNFDRRIPLAYQTRICPDVNFMTSLKYSVSFFLYSLRCRLMGGRLSDKVYD